MFFWLKDVNYIIYLLEFTIFVVAIFAGIYFKEIEVFLQEFIMFI